jgi:endo-alpha-1,4-polygalactosaminidase (GH114 family)
VRQYSLPSFSCSEDAARIPGRKAGKLKKNGQTAGTVEKTEEIPETSGRSYGVFLGIDSRSFSIGDFEDYDLIVIDAQELSSHQLAQLHLAGHTVYSYINIGSVEKSRDYFERFEDCFMGRYDNWPDEVWVDVTEEEWQDFVSEELLDEILDKDPELDGLFLDNLDVYSRISDMEDEDKTQDAYDALIGILETYQEERLPVIVNGADLFVDRLIKEGKTGLLKGVNQETVFSRIRNYDLDRFGKQKKKEKNTYLSYLERCGEAGLEVFLLEYTMDDALKKEIEQFCMENGYQYYISEHVDLGFSDQKE